MKKNNKGFTLTELIIVIVIIGILAGVLIPTLSGYVERSKVSADTQMVKGMNTVLQAEAIDQDVAYFESVDVIKDILAENGIDSFTTKSKKNTLWYNRSNNTVELLKTTDAISGVGAASIDEYSYQLEQISENPAYLYLDTRDNEITRTIASIYSFINGDLSSGFTKEAFDKCFDSKLTKNFNSVAKKLQNFSPERTLYVNETGYYTLAAADAGTNIISVYNVVFAKGITKFGNATNIAAGTIKVLNGFYVPSTIEASKLQDNRALLDDLDPTNEIIVQQSDGKLGTELVKLNLGCVLVVNENKSNTVELKFVYVLNGETMQLKAEGDVNTLVVDAQGKRGEIQLDITQKYVIDFTGKKFIFKSTTDFGLTTLTVYCYDEDKVVAAGIVKYVFLD